MLAVRALVDTLGWFRLTPWRLGFILLFFVTWVGTGSLIVTGQLSCLLLWPLTASWAAMRHGRWLKAGILIGLLVSVKPFLALLLVYFGIRRRLDGLAAGLLAFISAFLVGLAVFGLAAHMSWLRALGGVDWSWLVMNGSPLGFLSRLLSPSPGLVPLAQASRAIYPLWLLTAAGGLTLTVLSVVKQRGNVDRAFALLLIASPLALAPGMGLLRLGSLSLRSSRWKVVIRWRDSECFSFHRWSRASGPCRSQSSDSPQRWLPSLSVPSTSGASCRSGLHSCATGQNQWYCQRVLAHS